MLKIIILVLLMAGTVYAIQQVPDMQVKITTNTLTTITGVTNLNDLVTWLDTFVATGISTNIDHSSFTGNVWYTKGLLTNSVP